MPKPPPRYLSVQLVAAYFGVSNMTVYRMIDVGELPAIKVGRQFRIPVAALPEYTEQNAVKPEGAA